MEEGTVKQILKNSVAIYGKRGFDITIGLVSIAILARYFSLTDFGRYSFILAFVAVFKVISTMGVNTILTREIAKNKNEAVKFYSSALTIQFFLSVITFLIIAIGINLTGSSMVVIKATYLCALAVIFEFIGKTFSSVFQAFERMEFDAYKTILSRTVYLTAVIAVARFDLGLMGVFYALLLGSLVDVGYGLYVVSQRFIKLRLRDNSTQIWFLTKETIPLGLKRIFRRLSFSVDTLILAALKSKAEVGLFHGVYKIVQTLMFVAEGSLQAIFPVFARYYNTSNESFNLAYEKSFKFLVIVGIPVALFLSSFSSEVINLILGQKFLAAVPALQILSWVLALMFLTNLMERVLIVGGRQSICTWVTVIGLAINIIFDFLLIPRWSFTGASVATLIAEFVMIVLSFYYVQKLITRKRVFREALKPICSGMITLALLYLLRNSNFVLAAMLGCFSYLTILILTRTFTEEERLVVMRVFRNKCHLG